MPSSSVMLEVCSTMHVRKIRTLITEVASETHHNRITEKEDKRSFRQRLAQMLHPAPTNANELIDAIGDIEDNDVINADTRITLERVIRMADMTAADVMIAAPKIAMIDVSASYEEILDEVIDTAHSRLPVYQDSKDNIIGILMAKDLLKFQRSPDLNIRTLLRKPLLLPETKGLNDLLREFRIQRTHMALLFDEFGRISGLVTIEDVLEEIVGEIEDEFDLPEEEGDIFSLADNTWRISGDTPISRVEEEFDTKLLSAELEDEIDTIGGLIAHNAARVLNRGESFTLGDLVFEVLHAKGGAVRWFRVSRALTAHGQDTSRSAEK